VKQGHYASDARVASTLAADTTIDAIDDFAAIAETP
jgi:hypothetical protein